MGCGVEDTDLKQAIRQLADELADAHALLNAQQKKRAFGRHIFNAKELAYGLLHKMHAGQPRKSKAAVSKL